MFSLHFLFYSVAGLSRDYTAPSTLEDSRVTLSPGRYTKTVRVLINDDTALERPEHFLGNLVISPESAGIAKVTVPQAIVSIIDNDNV